MITHKNTNREPCATIRSASDSNDVLSNGIGKDTTSTNDDNNDGRCPLFEKNTAPRQPLFQEQKFSTIITERKVKRRKLRREYLKCVLTATISFCIVAVIGLIAIKTSMPLYCRRKWPYCISGSRFILYFIQFYNTALWCICVLWRPPTASRLTDSISVFAVDSELPLVTADIIINNAHNGRSRSMWLNEREKKMLRHVCVHQYSKQHVPMN